MDTGVTNIVDDKYATASSVWLQVNRQETTEIILHIDLYIFVCVCVCVCVFIGILYVLKFNFVGIIALIFSFVNFQNYIIH